MNSTIERELEQAYRDELEPQAVCQYPYDNNYICGRSDGFHDDEVLGHKFQSPRSEQAEEGGWVNQPVTVTQQAVAALAEMGASTEMTIALIGVCPHCQQEVDNPHECPTQAASEQSPTEEALRLAGYEQISDEAKRGLSLFLKEVAEQVRRSPTVDDDSGSIICDKHLEESVDIQGCIACEVERRAKPPIAVRDTKPESHPCPYIEADGKHRLGCAACGGEFVSPIVVDPEGLSAERCAEVLNSIEYRGKADWFVFVPSSSASWIVSEIKMKHSEPDRVVYLSDARILCAYYLSRGEVGK
jgi:hypothetical protein